MEYLDQFIWWIGFVLLILSLTASFIFISIHLIDRALKYCCVFAFLLDYINHRKEFKEWRKDKAKGGSDDLL